MSTFWVQLLGDEVDKSAHPRRQHLWAGAGQRDRARVLIPASQHPQHATVLQMLRQVRQRHEPDSHIHQDTLDQRRRIIDGQTPLLEAIAGRALSALTLLKFAEVPSGSRRPL